MTRIAYTVIGNSSRTTGDDTVDFLKDLNNAMALFLGAVPGTPVLAETEAEYDDTFEVDDGEEHRVIRVTIEEVEKPHFKGVN